MSRPAPVAWDVCASPLDPLALAASERGLVGLAFPGEAPPLPDSAREPAALAAAVAQVQEYPGGARQAFDLPLDLAGTPSSAGCGRRSAAVPYGATLSYGGLAAAAGRPAAVRAVGAAVGRTPVPIVVPCHRVVGADGALTGYRGGLSRKRALPDLERRGRR